MDHHAFADAVFAIVTRSGCAHAVEQLWDLAGRLRELKASAFSPARYGVLVAAGGDPVYEFFRDEVFGSEGELLEYILSAGSEEEPAALHRRARQFGMATRSLPAFRFLLEKLLPRLPAPRGAAGENAYTPEEAFQQVCLNTVLPSFGCWNGVWCILPENSGRLHCGLNAFVKSLFGSQDKLAPALETAKAWLGRPLVSRAVDGTRLSVWMANDSEILNSDACLLGFAEAFHLSMLTGRLGWLECCLGDFYHVAFRGYRPPRASGCSGRFDLSPWLFRSGEPAGQKVSDAVVQALCLHFYPGCPVSGLGGSLCSIADARTERRRIAAASKAAPLLQAYGLLGPWFCSRAKALAEAEKLPFLPSPFLALARMHVGDGAQAIGSPEEVKELLTCSLEGVRAHSHGDEAQNVVHSAELCLSRLQDK